MADFDSIKSVKHTKAATILAELQAFLSGEFYLSELLYEKDSLCRSYIESIEEDGSRLYVDGYLHDEPATCFSDARFHVEAEVSRQLREFRNTIKDHYPFEISGTTGNILTKKENITSVGLSYIWLRFYELQADNSENDYVQFSGSGTSGEENKFKKIFEKIFEFLAVFAVAGKYKTTAAWTTGSSRDATNFLEILNSICHYVNDGEAKGITKLGVDQEKVNDAGVDAIVITQPTGSIEVDSELYVVQATIQEKNLREKVVHSNKIDFFESFFDSKINVSKKGVLVVPHSEDSALKIHCARGNCVYVPLDVLYRSIGDAIIDGNMTVIGADFTKEYSNIEAHGFSCQKFD